MRPMQDLNEQLFTDPTLIWHEANDFQLDHGQTTNYFLGQGGPGEVVLFRFEATSVQTRADLARDPSVQRGRAGTHHHGPDRGPQCHPMGLDRHDAVHAGRRDLYRPSTAYGDRVAAAAGRKIRCSIRCTNTTTMPACRSPAATSIAAHGSSG